MTQPCKGVSIYLIFHHKNSSCNSARFPGCGGGEYRQYQGSRNRCLMLSPKSHALSMLALRVCGFPSLVPTRGEGLSWGGPCNPCSHCRRMTSSPALLALLHPVSVLAHSSELLMSQTLSTKMGPT